MPVIFAPFRWHSPDIVQPFLYMRECLLNSQMLWLFFESGRVMFYRVVCLARIRDIAAALSLVPRGIGNVEESTREFQFRQKKRYPRIFAVHPISITEMAGVTVAGDGAVRIACRGSAGVAEDAVQYLPQRSPRVRFVYACLVDCAECARCSELLKRAEQTNQAERAMLALNARSASATEWQRLYHLSEEARLEMGLARLELERHQRVHQA